MDRTGLRKQATRYSKRALAVASQGIHLLAERARRVDLEQRLNSAADGVRDRISRLDGEQKLIIVALVALVVASAVVTPMLMTGPSGSSDASDGRAGTVTEATPDGYNNVPENRVTTASASQEQLPEPNVQASVGSQTMDVTATTRDGEPVLQLADDRIHDGRWVAVDSQWFRETLGEVPQRAYITHESGDSYSTRVHVRDNQAAFYVRGFSTNTVEFSGEVSLSGSAATDGTQYQYELADLDAASDPNVTFTGHTNTQWDNASATGLANGDTLAVNPAGTHDPRGPNAGEPEVVFTGRVTEGSQQNQSGTGVASSGSASLSTIDGNRDPAGPSANNLPTIEVTGHKEQLHVNGWDSNPDGQSFGNDDSGPGKVHSEHQMTQLPSGAITEIAFNATTAHTTDVTLDIYINENGIDQSYGDGTLVKSGWTPSEASEKWYNIALDTAYSPSGSTVTIEFVTTSSTGLNMYYNLSSEAASSARFSSTHDGALQQRTEMELHSAPQNVGVNDGHGNSASLGDFSDGQTKTAELALDPNATALDFTGSGGSLDWTLTYTPRTATDSPAVDLDGDGTNDISHSGVLSNGQTASYQASSLGLTDDTIAVSTASGSTVDVAVNLEEVTKTRDPSLTLNGTTVASYAGELGDGATVNQTVSQDELKSGQNNLTISVGDGSLSADAPEPQVGFEYGHEATNRQSVAYASEHWSERYNVSKTYASTQANATLTVPFQGNVVGIRDIETRSNQTTWQSVPSSDYTLTNTTLTVDLGTVKANEEVEVRANGTKVQVANGTIQVLEPTTEGSTISTQVEITDKQNTDFHISYGGTSGRIYYTENESWGDPASYHYADSSGHKRLYTPNAPSGGTFHVHSIPVAARPTAGDVHITDPSQNSTEPAFNVSHGDHAGDDVEFTFQTATDGTDYVLYSLSNGLVRDSGTASSPLTLTDDDSVERLIFHIDNGSDGRGGSSGSSGSGGGVQVPMPNAGDGDPSWIPLLGVALALGGVVVTQRDPQAVENASSNVGTGFGNLFEPIPYVGEPIGMLVEASVEAVGQLVATVVGNRIVAMSLAGALIIGAVQGGIVTLPQGSLVIFVVAGVAVFSLVALREYGEWSTERWVFIVTATTILALEVVSPSETSLYAAVLNSPMFPLVIGGGLYLAYKGMKALRQPDRVTNVVVAGNQQEGEK